MTYETKRQKSYPYCSVNKENWHTICKDAKENQFILYICNPNLLKEISMNNQFTQRVSDILMYSKEEANRLGNSSISPEHLLLGLLREGEGKAIDILLNLHLNTKEIKSQLEDILKQNATDEPTPSEDLNFDEKASRVLKLCILEAKLHKNEQADSEHILLAIMKMKDSEASHILEKMDVTYQKIDEQLSLQPDTKNGLDFSEDEDDEENIRPNANGGAQHQNQTNQAQQTAKDGGMDTPALSNFGTDITKLAEEGKLDPVIGREKEIERLAQILSRRKKNNPILIGEPGVGKSAIVEGLALRITQKKVSRLLFGKRVVSLDLTSLVAGTKYRGQFEERIRSVINELKKNPQIILFIDEMHTLIGAGSGGGTMDAANILKPALARGEIQCIGATTLDEYKKFIEKDGALERRFQKIIVSPTTMDETLQILQNIKDKYEDHHNVTYTDKALQACVQLTNRYVTDRNFPDKAIDAMDEAGARSHLLNVCVPKEIEAQEKLIDETKELKSNAVKSQNFELAASYRDKEKEYGYELERLRTEWENNQKENRKVITEEEIANVVSMISGIPVQRLAKTENAQLLHMADELKKVVVSQDKAIDTLVKAVQRSRIGLKDPNKPIGTFMFLGPTGIGKTHLSKELARLLFGKSDAMIRIDMSEYMEKFNVSRLVGAPPGYVGYEEGGILTERVRRNPYSIVLLDEIEKAHPDVFNLLLQVMDEGRLTDSLGRNVDFRNTVIIMTSNVGTRQLKEFSMGIGFGAQNEMNEKAFAESTIKKALTRTFSPEFLNRVDEIINFETLDMDALIHIINIELKGLYQRVENLGYKLSVDEAGKQFIAQKGYDKQFGARPLKRAIQKYLEDEITSQILNNTIEQGQTLAVTYNKEEKKLNYCVIEAEIQA